MIKRILLALVIGTLATAVLAVLAFAADRAGLDALATGLFWQNSLLQGLVPLGNMGTPEHPVYEGTPLNILAFFASFPLGILIYGGAAYALLNLRRNRLTGWHGIVYREYWDFPRMIIARRGEETFLFYSRFDEDLDDYVDHYQVFRMPPLTNEELRRSWAGVESRALEALPSIGLRELPFALTRRNSTDMDVLLRRKGS